MDTLPNTDILSKYEKMAEKLKAIAHPHRLCIVRGLIHHSCNVSKIQDCLCLPQSTVSQHLAKLRSIGIIKGERNGLEISYTVVDEDIKNIVLALYPEQDSMNI